MQFGLELAPWGEYADPRVFAELAREAETAGWDGLFVWDAMLHDPDRLPKADPWVALAAVAAATERIKIGTMVTPVPRRRPWKLAREAVTLDFLSGGRLILGVGIGDPSDEEFEWFGEPGVDHRTRAEMLDEGLEIIAGLWSGEPFSFQGKHYQLHEMTFTPTPLQRPRIPIWVGGWWPNKRPMRRAARWDGAHPGRLDGPVTPDDVRDIVAYIRSHRTDDTPFDVAVGGRPPSDDPDAVQEHVRAMADAGLTWWLEVGGVAGHAADGDSVLDRIRQGPPRLAP